ncbi:MAG: right-handed parallel beta-helix repeat-containing protein, partial [Candidatus Syntrophosphaera sp.]
MKKLIALALLATLGAMCWLYGDPLTGTKTIGPPGSDYGTFSAAIADLNTNGVGAGGVTFLVSDGSYAENTPAITAIGTEANQIVFQPQPGAEPVLVPAGGDETHGFKLTGAQWVTFDNIDVYGPADLEYGYYLAAYSVAASQHNTIQNCNISLLAGTSTNYGIYSRNSGAYSNSHNSILNNTIENFRTGINFSSFSSSDTYSEGNLIQENTIRNARNYGIYLGYAYSAQINSNAIHFEEGGSGQYYGINVYSADVTADGNSISGGSTSGTIHAIRHHSGDATYLNNTVTGPAPTAYSAWYGLYPSGGTTTWENNTVSGIHHTGSGAIYTVYVGSGTHTFDGNQITAISGSGSRVYGFYVIGSGANQISSNTVSQLEYLGTGTGLVYGINLASGTSTVFNNMIGGLAGENGTTAPQIRGLAVSSGQSHSIWNNSVHLSSTGSGNHSSAALYVGSTTAAIDLRNNILVNESQPGPSGKCAAFWKTFAGVDNLLASSDKNVYYAGIPGPQHLIGVFGASEYQTLHEYQDMADPVDPNAFAEDVPFLETGIPLDLHVATGIPTCVEG